ncbi:MAG TPA: catalase family protein [Variovorax sp.]|nr:catalase family protein [Variovorax sp.]
MTYLPYSADIETPDADENEAIDGIVEAMTHESRIVADREHHAVRASHAKSTGLLVGTLTIAPGLPPELAQGLFAAPGTHDVAVRLAQGPGETLSDRVSTHRGMAIKVFGVRGEKLAGHVDDTQDFVLASGPTFPSGTAKGFLRDARQLESATPLSEGVKSAVSSVARNLNKVLEAVGTESAKADFFGHPFSHPLSEPYYSQAPIRYGDFVAKVAVFPASPELLALAGAEIDTKVDPEGFRTAVTGFMRNHEAVFDLRVQLWTDAETQPIEDASVEWPEQESPFRTVATLRLAPQEAHSAARARYFDDVMTFRPAHSLAMHRPLGSVMRARLKVYAALSAFRHRRNGVAPEEPAGIDRLPA